MLLRCGTKYGVNRMQRMFMSQDNKLDHIKEEYIISKFYKQEIVPEAPITSLNIVDRSVKVKKVGSFSCDLYTGRYDHDYLTYPEPLYDRVEVKKLKDQAVMVKQLYPKIWDDDKQLQKYNFFNMFQLSVTEMMSLFESIGSSIEQCYDKHEIVGEDGSYGSISNRNSHSHLSRAILSLITRNCLTYWPIYKSNNDKAKLLLPDRHIQFGGLSESDKDPYKTIGFCWTEQAPMLGNLPPQEWQTLVQTGDDLLGHHLITGTKTSILNEDADHYLVFYRDKYLAEHHEAEELGHEPNPASDPFAGCSLLHKSELNFSPPYRDSAGVSYHDASIDCTIQNDRMLIEARRKDPTAVNVKALGQMATCAVTMGMLKDALARTYKNLIDFKPRLLNCDVVEHKLSSVTMNIYALESMLYYISGMYDGLEKGFDAHMEATILKILTYEFTHKALQELQQINGSDLTNLARTQDQLNTLDCFLDGNIYNRLYLSTMGVLWFARSKNVHLNKLRLAPWYWGYFVKHILREMTEKKDWMTLDADVRGQLHPSLNDAAVNLEYIVKRIKWATEHICMKHGEDVTAAQSSLYKLSQITIDSFLLTTMCARASKSYCNGSRNADMDVTLTDLFSDRLARKVKLYMEELQTSDFVIERRARMINELNIKAGGYYAESPLDPNI